MTTPYTEDVFDTALDELTTYLKHRGLHGDYLELLDEEPTNATINYTYYEDADIQRFDDALGRGPSTVTPAAEINVYEETPTPATLIDKITEATEHLDDQANIIPEDWDGMVPGVISIATNEQFLERLLIHLSRNLSNLDAA